MTIAAARLWSIVDQYIAVLCRGSSVRSTIIPDLQNATLLTNPQRYLPISLPTFLLFVFSIAIIIRLKLLGKPEGILSVLSDCLTV